MTVKEFENILIVIKNIVGCTDSINYASLAQYHRCAMDSPYGVIVVKWNDGVLRLRRTDYNRRHRPHGATRRANRTNFTICKDTSKSSILEAICRLLDGGKDDEMASYKIQI